MSSNKYLGTGLVVMPESRRFATALHEGVPHAGVDAITESLTAVRIVSTAGPDFHQAREIFRRCVDHLSDYLPGGDAGSRWV